MARTLTSFPLKRHTRGYAKFNARQDAYRHGFSLSQLQTTMDAPSSSPPSTSEPAVTFLTSASRLELLYFSAILPLMRTTLFIIECCTIFILLVAGYAAFTVLGYALLSISTVSRDHYLSVVYASLIGGIILIPPVCITSELTFRYVCDNVFTRYPPYVVARYWMAYVPRALIMPVFLGGGALGLKILGTSSFGEARLVDKAHLVAASALGGFIFQVIYEVLRALIVMVILSHQCRRERFVL
ncbi:hypothetical protein BDZ89DRAFT_363051 [Hymenopellis radicata]|nr:hypothetical protein BDZ89DRAFT_363051 [Hymenopellis radicata]